MSSTMSNKENTVVAKTAVVRVPELLPRNAMAGNGSISGTVLPFRGVEMVPGSSSVQASKKIEPIPKGAGSRKDRRTTPSAAQLDRKRWRSGAK